MVPFLPKKILEIGGTTSPPPYAEFFGLDLGGDPSFTEQICQTVCGHLHKEMKYYFAIHLCRY